MMSGIEMVTPVIPTKPMMTEQKTAMAPTDRSIPAVSTTSACAQPRMPTMAICCRIVDRVEALKKLSAATPKTASATIRTINGTAEGVWCSQCCRRFSAPVSS